MLSKWVMTNKNTGYYSDRANIVRILDLRASINQGVDVQAQRIKELTEKLKQLGCGPMRDHILREIATHSHDLRLWTEIGEQFEDLALRCPPEDPPIKGDDEIEAEAEDTEISIEDEIAYIIRRIQDDVVRCQVARAEFEALTFCLTGKASYIGSMTHLVAEKRALCFNEWLLSDIYDYIDFYSGMGWHHELCDSQLEQLFGALREVHTAETNYNKLWRSSAD